MINKLRKAIEDLASEEINIGSGQKNKAKANNSKSLEEILTIILGKRGFQHKADLSAGSSKLEKYDISINSYLSVENFIVANKEKISNHDKFIMDIKKQSSLISKNLKMGIYKSNEFNIDNFDFDIGDYITQPNSSNNSPDILVCVGKGLYVGIEIKSIEKTKSNTMFNAHVPSKGIIYILGYIEKKSIALFAGDQLLDDKLREIIDVQIRSDSKEIEKQLKTKVGELAKGKLNVLGLTFYSRFAVSNDNNIKFNPEDVDIKVGLTVDEVFDQIEKNIEKELENGKD